MSNVVHLNVPSRSQREAERHNALLRSFAQHRRLGDDVFWLKENAELLNILECTGARPTPQALEAHEEFYTQAEKRLGFFPQYYRFLLSICLDLEDLGMAGDKGEALVAWVAGQGMAEAELSDLQRGEARRLMQRRGHDPMVGDVGLDDRLHRFIARPAIFALPNKKAAYELTHTIFYLSEYGRRVPVLGREVRQSLDFAGTLAFLDRNADLLAEICIAMSHGGFTPPEIWQDWLSRHARGFEIDTGAGACKQDDYHEFFVCNWYLAVAGEPAFARSFAPERMAFHRPDSGSGMLREVSESLFQLDERRSDDWERMRPLLCDTLSETAAETLLQAETASRDFAAFFAGFARADRMGAGA